MSDADQREEAVFEAALQLPPEERVAYLDKTCAGAAELRRRVEVLLGALERASSFMKVPAVSPPAEGEQRPPGVSPTEKPGDRIGRYKLLEQIGEGGCGVVYVAEQEEPMRRRVALKIIKLGMDTKQVMARFNAERQALAMMDHPNIARVFDAAATETGRPYFVMELVRGVKITDFCDENTLSTEERLTLFMQVCQAIQHAHQKGIIHRDIKPSNILVTINDGVPVPKVIDFGIAKATQGRLTDQTVYTAFEQFIGTPAYMSPEQAAMTSLDVDTRSDIYSLGVLLYELLTGKTPFDTKELLATGLDEMRRTIREKEPDRPSNRLNTMMVAELTTTAKHRHTDAPRLIHLLRGDLDWIVMKCLEKTRARRYETASGLAADISRHLNNEPVAARPPSRWYRFQKTVQRNKVAFAAGTAVAAVLVVGLAVSTREFLKEKAARQRAVAAEREQSRLREEAQAARGQAEADRKKAQMEAQKTEQVAQILKDMLTGVQPSVALGRDTTLLKDILDKRAERIGADLKDQPAVEAELRTTMGQVYYTLGDLAKAESMFRGAVTAYEKAVGADDRALVLPLGRLALTLRWELRPAEAERVQLRGLKMAESFFGTESAEAASALDTLAFIYRDQHKAREAENAERQALAIRRKVFGNEHEDVALSLNNLAMVLQRTGDPSEVEKLYGEAIALRRKLFHNEHPELARSLNNLAVHLRDHGRLAEAESYAREALAMRRKFLGPDHPDLIGTQGSLSTLSSIFRDQGRFAEAEPLYRESLIGRKKTLGVAHMDTLLVMNNLAYALRKQGKVQEASDLEGELSALESSSSAGKGFGLFFAVKQSLRSKGKLSESPILYAAMSEAQKKLLSAEPPAQTEVLINAGFDLLRRKRVDEASALCTELLNKLGPESAVKTSRLGSLISALREELIAGGKNSEADALSRQWRASAERDAGRDLQTAESKH